MSRSARLSSLAAVATATAITALAAPAGASAQQVTITSFDGTKIDADFQPATGLKAGQTAPTIVMTHGFGLVRETTEASGTEGALGQVGAGAFRRRGYNTITFDSRGFGRSGGEIDLDSPQTEGRDASAVIDYVAKRPEAQLDGKGDPRVGMHGASYGGGVQWAAASRDRRIDALVPAISWTSLPQALGREGRLKFGWGAGLLGLGIPSSAALGALAPQGPETGGFPPELLSLAVQGAASGDVNAEFRNYLQARSTGDAIAKVRAPALILQGTADTLFGLDQSIEMRRLLRRAGTPTKLLWFCGGHGVCLTGNRIGAQVEPRTLAWMDRWLKNDKAAKVGPAFEWNADDDVVRSAADYPLASGGTITASSAGGTLGITPVSTLNGLLVIARPAISAVEAAVPKQAKAADVVGSPTVRFRYRGTSSKQQTHVFGQILDVDRGIVVGNQATPIPVTLDGRSRVVERPLEAVAMHLTPGSHYRLQITDGTNDYGLTAAAGTVRIEDLRMTLPVGDAARTKADPAFSGAGLVQGAAADGSSGSAGLGRATRRVSLKALAGRGILLKGLRPTGRRVTVRATITARVAKRVRTKRLVGRTTVPRGAVRWTRRLKVSKATARRLRTSKARTIRVRVRVSKGRVRPTTLIVRR